MLKKFILILTTVFLLALSFSAFANDADEIKRIHAEVKKLFLNDCRTEINGATDVGCDCLASKAEESLDDVALKDCIDNKKDGTCVTDLVSAASAKAVSQDGMSMCMPQEAVSANANANAAQATQLSSNDSDDNDEYKAVNEVSDEAG